MITESQREARMHGIGGSDAPIVLGISPHKTAVELWQEKTGQADPPNLDDVEVIQWGNLLEDVVAAEFSRRTGLKLRRVNETLADRRDPFLMAHLDRRVVGEPALVEIKTTRGLDGDTARADHVTQVMHYMNVADLQRAFLVYLVAGQRMVYFEIARDDQAIGELVEAERTFWRHVRDRTPPPARSAFDLRLLFRHDLGGGVIADDSVREAVDQLAAIKTSIKQLEADAEVAEKVVLEAMGEASLLLDDTGKVLATWRQSKPSRTFDRTRLEAEHPEIAAQYMVEKPGSRRFLLKVAP
jgi:putative phage-type endonuclease